MKDHMKSKKHLSRKDTKSKQKSTSKQVKLPPVPVANGIHGSMQPSTIHPISHIHVYEGFFKSEKGIGRIKLVVNSLSSCLCARI